MKEEDFQITELDNAYVKNTWYAITVSFGSIAYSHNRKDNYSKVMFIISFGFTISAMLISLKINELIMKHPELFDIKLKLVCYIFNIAIIALLYISTDCIYNNILK